MSFTSSDVGFYAIVAFILITILVVVFAVFQGATAQFAQSDFCESVGLEWDGYSNSNGSRFECIGESDGYFIVKEFFDKDGEYLEVLE